MLKIRIRRVSITQRSLSLSIQSNKVFSNILNLLFGFVLQVVPSVGAKTMKSRSSAILSRIARDFVKGMNANVKNIVVFVHQTNGFLNPSIVF